MDFSPSNSSPDNAKDRLPLLSPLEFPATRLIMIGKRVVQMTARLTGISEAAVCEANRRFSDDLALNMELFKYLVLMIENPEMWVHDSRFDGYTDGKFVIYPSRKTWALYDRYDYKLHGKSLEKDKYKYSFNIRFIMVDFESGPQSAVIAATKNQVLSTPKRPRSTVEGIEDIDRYESHLDLISNKKKRKLINFASNERPSLLGRVVQFITSVIYTPVALHKKSLYRRKRSSLSPCSPPQPPMLQEVLPHEQQLSPLHHAHLLYANE